MPRSLTPSPRSARPAFLRATLLLAAVLALAGCESLIAARAASDHPVEGRLVDIGGRRIHLNCIGEGSPTLVFQAGGDVSGALAWTPVHQRAAEVSRACTYSRAGVLWSDPAPGPFTPEEAATDLKAALDAAGETGPFVLIGHSRGGLYNLIFASMYRAEVAGLIFADSSHPDQEARFADAGLVAGPHLTPSQELGLAFAWTGWMRLVDYPADPLIADRVEAYYPKSARALAREARGYEATLERAGRTRDLVTLPVVVLARQLADQVEDDFSRDRYSTDGAALRSMDERTRAETIWRALQTDLSTWSARGRLEVVPGSTHAFYYRRPDVILDAITDVVTAVRVRRRPSPPAG
ncbi:alpha/beta fold hydrolase [bacterium]|nr:alpha/beta fold hydrolase [bacterium]